MSEMTRLKQQARNHYISEDGKTEIFVRRSGSKVKEGNFGGGNWKFSPKHADMMPHQETFAIFVNGERAADGLFEEDIKSELRRLRFQI